ncbi:MAG: Trm112 family protein [Collinsella aerofaciens]
MAFESVNYQCPACGGPLHFASAEQKLVCDYCDSRVKSKRSRLSIASARTRQMPKPMRRPQHPSPHPTMRCRAWPKTPAISARRVAPS